MTFPSSLVHWPWFWLKCPQCLSHPLLKGALKCFPGIWASGVSKSQPQSRPAVLARAAKQEESTEVRTTNPSLPRASSCHNGCVLWENPRDTWQDQNQRNTFTLILKITAKPLLVQQGSFSPPATVWLPGDTALRSQDPKTSPTWSRTQEFSISKGQNSKQKTLITN